MQRKVSTKVKYLDVKIDKTNVKIIVAEARFRTSKTIFSINNVGIVQVTANE
jgi:hypothetical protein